MTDIDLVVNLKLREDVLLEKCLGRRICSQCGKGFNVASINAEEKNGLPAMSMAPLLPPPNCASKLITRSDDTELVVKERLSVYYEKVNLILCKCSVNPCACHYSSCMYRSMCLSGSMQEVRYNLPLAYLGSTKMLMFHK